MVELVFCESWIGGGLYGKGRLKRRLNKYRFVESNIEGKYIEFEVKDIIAKCDVGQEDLLKMYSWRLHSNALRTCVLSKNISFKHEVLKTKRELIVNINEDVFDCRKINLKVLKQLQRPDLVNIAPKSNIDVPEFVKIGEWRGGKPMGCVSSTGHSYVVRFSTPKLHKWFTFSKYKTIEDAKKAAETFRYQEARRRDEIYNKIREVTTKSGQTYLEVSLNGGKILLCDVEDKKIVQKCIWSARQGNHTCYVEHTPRKGLKLPSERFHRLITNYEIVDHINGNGLDNRKCNLREGGNGVNERNAIKRKDNTSGVTGVAFTKGAWVVQWPEDGIRKSKRFGKSCGDLEKAKEAAISFRLQKNEELNLHPRQ